MKRLDIVQATKAGDTADFEFHLVRTDTSVQLRSAPSMVVTATPTLIIRYGTKQSDNNCWTTTLTEAGVYTVHSDAGGYAPTQSALVYFNGSVHAFDKQNNSDNGVFVSKLDDNGVEASSGTQISGFYTPNGLSGIVYGGALLVAVKSNGSNHTLWMFSSSNGTTWTGHEYTNIAIGYTPSIANFNDEVAVAFMANDSSYALFSAWGQ